MTGGRVQWQKAEETRKDFNIILIHQDKKFFYLWALQGHSGRNLIDLSLQDNVLIPNDFFEYIYHIGCAINLQFIVNSLLRKGGQNWNKRQTVFFTSVDLLNKEHEDPDVIDLNASRLVWYKQKVWKNIKTLCIVLRSNLLKRMDLSSIKHDLRHAPSLLYPESYHDGIWKNHLRNSICFTSTSSGNFLRRQLDERIGFRSCVKTPNKSNQRPKIHLLEQGDLFCQSNNPVLDCVSTNERTGRLVSSGAPVSVKRLDQVKDADENVDADHVRTGWTLWKWTIHRFVHTARRLRHWLQSVWMATCSCETSRKLLCSWTSEKDRESSSSMTSSSRFATKQCRQPSQWRIKSPDSWHGQCRVVRAMRNNSKSAMLRMPSLLETRNSLLHLWTYLERKWSQPTFSPIAIGRFLNRELRHQERATSMCSAQQNWSTERAFHSHNVRRRCLQKKFDGIQDRFQRDSTYRDSQLKIGWTEETCIAMDKLAQENHSHCPLLEEFER